MNEAIFGSLSRRHQSSAGTRAHHHASRVLPPNGQPALDTPVAAQTPRFAPEASASTSTDVALMAIIEAPLQFGETAAAGFARKEAELRKVLAPLGVPESRALQSRLSNPRSGDQLAAAFMRLTGERRARLINFLADARRREATRR